MMSIPAQESEPQNYLWLTATPNGLWIALTAPENRDCPAWLKSAVESSVGKPSATTTASRTNSPVRVVLRGLGATPSPEAAKKKEESVKNALQKNGIQQVEFADRIGVDFEIPQGKDAGTLPQPGERIAVKVKPHVATAEEIAKQKALREKQKQNERERGDIIRDFPNAITCELKPTDTGLKLSILFEEAYFQWFAKAAQHTLEEANEQ